MHEALERASSSTSAPAGPTHDGCEITSGTHVATPASSPGRRPVHPRQAGQHQKIDAAMADVLAHEAAADAREAGLGQDVDTKGGGLPVSLTDDETAHAALAEELDERPSTTASTPTTTLSSRSSSSAWRPAGARQFLTIVNWPRLAVDSVEERLDVEGFRYPNEDQADDELWRVWQENNLDEESQLAHTDALVFKRSYACVGTNEDDDQTPIVTVESPREVIAELDVRTRQLVAAPYLSPVGKQLTAGAQQATLYLPDKTVWLERDGAPSGRRPRATGTRSTATSMASASRAGRAAGQPAADRRPALAASRRWPTSSA
jgi:hypothetical protein